MLLRTGATVLVLFISLPFPCWRVPFRLRLETRPASGPRTGRPIFGYLYRFPWPVMKLASSDARKGMAARWERYSSGIDEFAKVNRRAARHCAPIPPRRTRLLARRRTAHRL